MSYESTNKNGHHKQNFQVAQDIVDMLGLPKEYELIRSSGGGNDPFYLNNFRIWGGKPWGGGRTTWSGKVRSVDLIQAMIRSNDALRELAGYIAAAKQASEAST